MRTFAEIFCERRHISQGKYARAVFWRCLHRHALPLAPLVMLLNAEHFRPDFDLIASVARLTDTALLHDELADFCSDSRNFNLLRRRLRIRVSAARLQHLVHHTMSTGKRIGVRAAMVRQDARV